MFFFCGKMVRTYPFDPHIVSSKVRYDPFSCDKSIMTPIKWISTSASEYLMYHHEEFQNFFRYSCFKYAFILISKVSVNICFQKVSLLYYLSYMIFQ